MEEKAFYLTVRGQRVEVTEEVYRAYIRPVRAEQKRQYRAIGKYSVCSVESMLSNGVEVADEGADSERILIEEEERQEELSTLKAVFGKLAGRDRQIINMVYSEGKTHAEVACYFGVSRAAITRWISKILKIFRDFFAEGEKKKKNLSLLWCKGQAKAPFG